MAINQNPHFSVSGIVEMYTKECPHPVDQALLEAEIWERKAINTLYSCVDKDQTSPTVQNVIMRGQWQMEVADNYLQAAVQMEQGTH